MRDSTSDVTNASASSLPHIHDSFHAEAIACLFGIHADVERGMGHVEIETNATMLKLAS